MTIEPQLADANQLALSRAILIYQDGEAAARGGNSAGSTVGQTLATVHDVEFDYKEQRSVVTHGQLLDRDALSGVLQGLVGAQGAKRQLVPEHLLCADESLLLWWAPASRRTIYFSTADTAFNADVHGKTVLHPPLVFKATSAMLYVYALAQNQRPNEATQMCVAPYCNLYENGSMCRGDVRLPASLAPNTMPQWEGIFYDSRFTHSNLHAGRMTAHPDGHNGLWREMVGFEGEVFPEIHLTKTRRTLGQLLNDQAGAS